MVTVLADGEMELVSRAQQGDRSAFGELVRHHYSGVVNVVYRMCGDARLAEDAAQEAFIQAWLHISSYRQQAPLRNWLYRIAINAALDVLRHVTVVLPEPIESMELVDPVQSPEALVLREERTVQVQHAVLSLPAACRSVLVLREYGELSYQEIAAALDIPTGTVMSRLNYARTLLRRKLLEPQLEYAEDKND